ncbi:MAG TPA: hypothetical protein VLE96_06465 [Chlamydiales bacterium]|nr:hypothetical protein [Chlamydiales bacterium]
MQRSSSGSKDKAYQGFRILQIAYIIVPLIAGLDKFMHLLANWDKYLAPVVAKTVNYYGHELMLVVGAIEIIVGVGIIFLPKVFSYIVAAWLLCIVINLLIIGNYFDIALRDFGLCLGALALARLSQKYT